MTLRLDVESLVPLLKAEAPWGIEPRPLATVVIDSRQAGPGALFVGLPGERVHGQTFAAGALAAGAAAVIVEDAGALGERGGPNVLVVPSAERALQELGRRVRTLAEGLPFIGLTGTNGKTTTKEVVAAVLRALGRRVHATKGNLNNHLGLPLSLASLPVDADCGVFELGMSNPGEIDAIAAILRPTMGLITCIGEAHLETMGTVERIVDAKCELLAHLPPDGPLFLNADCPWHEEVARRHRGRSLLVGVSPEARPRGLAAELLEARTDADGSWGRLLLDGNFLGTVRLPIPGLHVASSFLFACLAARELGAAMEAIPAALGAARPAWGRMETRMMSGVRVLFDGYNANPASMRGALRLLASLPGRRLAVLGEMRELGPIRDRAHADVAREAVGLLGPDRVFLLGDVWPGDATAGARCCPDLPSLAEAVRLAVRDGDTLLVKASRGVGLERLLPLVFPGAGSEGSH